MVGVSSHEVPHDCLADPQCLARRVGASMFLAVATLPGVSFGDDFDALLQEGIKAQDSKDQEDKVRARDLFDQACKGQFADACPGHSLNGIAAS